MSISEPTPLPEWIKLSCEKIEPVGSRVTCNPPPMDTDEDWLCLLYPTMDIGDFTEVLENNEYEGGGSMEHKQTWRSFKKGELNLLITQDPEHFSLFMAATAEAKRLNLMLKSERITLFEKMVPQKKEVHVNRFASLLASLNNNNQMLNAWGQVPFQWDTALAQTTQLGTTGTAHDSVLVDGIVSPPVVGWDAV